VAERRTVKNSRKQTKTPRRPAPVFIEPPPPSPLRGLLATPPEVEEVVEGWLKDRPASPEARRRITENLKLQSYFGGHEVAYRDTPQGREIIAVGSEEVRRLVRKSSGEQLRGVVFGQADPW
jgi:hypothetical protein